MLQTLNPGKKAKKTEIWHDFAFMGSHFHVYGSLLCNDAAEIVYSLQGISVFPVPRSPFCISGVLFVKSLCGFPIPGSLFSISGVLFIKSQDSFPVPRSQVLHFQGPQTIIPGSKVLHFWGPMQHELCM